MLNVIHSIRDGLARTRKSLADKVGALVLGEKIDEGALDDHEAALIAADIGAPTASLVLADLKERFKRQELAMAEQVRGRLKLLLLGILALRTAALAVTPAGVGIGVDAELIRGGGFLALTPGRYAGALSLTVQERIGIQVAGVAITRTTPDDKPTFSFKMLGTADFSVAPIQLGLGFALFGLGLALAIECRMNEDALRAGVYDGSLRSLLFPTDLAQHSAGVLADLDRCFPACPGAFVVGAMAKLGWGGGIPLVGADVGVFIEHDRGVRVALAGVVTADLPSPRAPVLRLRAQVLGLLDLPGRSLAIKYSDGKYVPGISGYVILKSLGACQAKKFSHL